jgi:hypothetical protein
MIYPKIQVYINNDKKIRSDIDTNASIKHLLNNEDWTTPEYIQGNYFAYTTVDNDININDKRKGINPLLSISTFKIDSSLDNLTETAEITINRKYLIGSGKNYIKLLYNRSNILKSISSNGYEFDYIPDSYYTLIKLLDVIEINAGYYQDTWAPLKPNDETQIPMNKRFMGFVTEITVRDTDILIKCEDNMGYLKTLESKNISNPNSTTLLELLDKIKTLWGLDFDYLYETQRKSITSYNFKDITFTNYNPLDIFKYLSDSGLVCYFRRNILYVGLKYWNTPINSITETNSTWDSQYGRFFRFSDPWYRPIEDHTHKLELNGTNPIIDKKLDYNSISVDDIIININTTDPYINGTILKDTKLSCWYKVNSGSTELFNWECSNQKINLTLLTGDENIIRKDNLNIFSHESSKKIVYNLPNKSISSIKDLCRGYSQLNPKQGFTGTFTTFGLPYIMKGDLLLCNFNARSENIVSNTGDENYIDFILPIKWETYRSTNKIMLDATKGLVQDNDQYKDTKSEIELPFWLYVADDVNTTYDSKSSIRQEIRIEKVPASYLDKNLALNSLQQFNR